MPTANGEPFLEALWDSRTLACVVLVAEAIAAALSLSPGTQIGWISFGITSFMTQWTALLTLAGLYIFRHHLRQARPVTIAKFTLALLLIAAALVLFVAMAVVGGGWSMGTRNWLELLLRTEGIALTVGLLGMWAFHTHWRARQYAIRAKQFELEALRARIQPHFLFNTLNTGAALVRLNPARAECLLMDLAELFRATLAGPEHILLSKELDIAKHYLDIEQLRFGERLSIVWKVPDAIPPVTVPSLSIQPLVENAIRHGVELRPGASQIVVEVRQTSDTIVVEVSSPLPPDKTTARTGHQVGLAAVRARLHDLDSRMGLQTMTQGDQFLAALHAPLAEIPSR
ncbi:MULTISPECIES: sensor histidine kinase [Xanthomonas]|uniref:Histidine kinase n=2 Tax=Xanthomonas phaseoli TaxID=1985254 RepID=A0AB34QEY9_XANCH|nr:histidine kinase [Xanthomonas phaseoli]RWU15962.1 sensor histidine kinase [Xanthomonas phaseoli pv. manihotis str. CIO151]ATS21745.1 histidine kinase [Xanthomonas phaseoli pv. phaseoli]ATS32871.1 histidine kinase [Xanthomonas phaseoli pv. phaseoli]KGT50593.1 histidine kinase [Xanthomonas phaseoli pv. phaseoli]KHD62596.1 histidine kinase [Xanthomonas phaseoli pv. phaseoli]